MNEPPESQQWMTQEIRELLAKIPAPHEAKRRRTVILLAFAHATQTPIADVFERDDTCASQIWWQKWQYVPEISEALEACKARALDWVDDQTVSIEEHFRRQRRKAIAEYAAQAPEALKDVMTDLGLTVKGSDRILAAETLMRWAEPETGQKLGRSAGSASIEQRVDVYDLSRLSDEELNALARLAERPAGADDGAGPAPAG